MTRKRPPTAPPEEPEKKERVIHTRVPESLEAELRKRAEGLGISVSNLVRNVLGHAFGLVGDVVADSHAIARAARGERVRVDIVAWQPLVMAKLGACARCGTALAKGARAALGVTDDGSPGPIVCTSCKENADDDR
ncbi:MAG TPA: hypothetical protein VMJ10_29005 [Kofleriaceae bacterium]|nr:hypothetical protein [Kofleriaceae bacterium]